MSNRAVLLVTSAVAGVLSIAAVVFLVVALRQMGDPGPQKTADDRVAISDIQPGDCMHRWHGHDVERVTLVPCRQRHGLEAFASFDLPDGRWPGADRVAGAAQNACTRRLSHYVSDRFHPAWFAISDVYPVRADWPADRQVLCFVAATGSGSVADGSFAPPRGTNWPPER